MSCDPGRGLAVTRRIGKPRPVKVGQLISSGIVNKLAETRRLGPHRAPFLCQFNKVQYDQALENGLALIF